MLLTNTIKQLSMMYVYKIHLLEQVAKKPERYIEIC